VRSSTRGCAPLRERPGVRHTRSGFTLIEILVVLSIVGILAALATIRYVEFAERARVARAVVEIKSLETEVRVWSAERNDELPASLAAAGISPPNDPWGNPYRYLRIVQQGPGSTLGQARKDRFLVPINSDFDLYSVGRDGLTKPTLHHKDSRDDVVRANDGAFIGLAERF
jgi:general secretion pathway protein G